jgi:hypothetical protein
MAGRWTATAGHGAQWIEIGAMSWLGLAQVGWRAYFAGGAKAAALARDFYRERATLSGTAPLGEYRTLESDFLYGFDAVAVVPLGSQQPLPAICQAQPKLSIAFVMRVRGELSALLDLVLEEVGCFDHCDHHNKSPAHRGFNKLKTRQPSICSDGSREEADQPTRSSGMPRGLPVIAGSKYSIARRIAGGAPFTFD